MSLALLPNPPHLARLQVDPVFDDEGTLLHFQMQAYFAQDLVDDSTTPPTKTPQPWTGPFTVFGVADKTKTVTTSLGEVSYEELVAAIIAATHQEREVKIAADAVAAETAEAP